MLRVVHKAGAGLSLPDPAPWRLSLSGYTFLSSPRPLLLLLLVASDPPAEPWFREEPLVSSGRTLQTITNSLEKV